MSIFEQQKDLESFPDQLLVQEAKQPSGSYPQFLIAAEIQRRADLRQRFMAQQQKGDAPTVIDQRVARMGGGMPVQQNVPQQGQNPAPVQGGIASLPQGYSQGGLVQDPDDPLSASANRYNPVVTGAGLDLSKIGSGIVGLLDSMTRGSSYRPVRPMAQSRGPATPDFNPNARAPYPASDKLMSFLEQYAMRGGTPTDAIGTPAANTPDASDTSSVMDRTDLTDRSSGAGASVRAGSSGGNPQIVTLSQRAANNVEDMMDRMGRLDGMTDEYVEGLRDLSDEEQAILAGVVEQYEQGSAVERALQEQRRTPEELRADRRSRALAGIGVAIGGAREVGDVARAMGGVFDSVESMREEQRQEENEIMLQLATAEDARMQATAAVKLDGLARKRNVLNAIQDVQTASLATQADGMSRLGNAAANLHQAFAQAAYYDEMARAAGQDSGIDVEGIFSTMMDAANEKSQRAADYLMAEGYGDDSLPPEGTDARMTYETMLAQAQALTSAAFGLYGMDVAGQGGGALPGVDVVGGN